MLRFVTEHDTKPTEERLLLTLDEYKAEVDDYYADAIEASGKDWQVISDYRVRLAEIRWMKAGRPYFNVAPNIVPHLVRVNLQKIPLQFLRLPDDLSVFTITTEDTVSLFWSDPNEAGDETINCYTQLPQNQRMGLFWNISLAAQRCIDDVLAEAFAKTPGDDKNELWNQTIRLYCACRFLHNCPNDDLIQVDLADRFVDKWEGASPGARADYLRKSRNEGKGGYNVGVNSRLLEDADRLTKPREGGKGNELEHAHIRTGHIHAVRCGEGKKDIKLMWFRPTVVRPDLPFKES